MRSAFEPRRNDTLSGRFCLSPFIKHLCIALPAGRAAVHDPSDLQPFPAVGSLRNGPIRSFGEPGLLGNGKWSSGTPKCRPDDINPRCIVGPVKESLPEFCEVGGALFVQNQRSEPDRIRSLMNDWRQGCSIRKGRAQISTRHLFGQAEMQEIQEGGRNVAE